MAKRKRRAAAGKKTTLKRRKAGKRGAAVRRKAAKRATARKPAKRVARKKAAAPKQKPATAIIEDTIVDIVEEPVPGVTVVTELETVRTIRPPQDKEGSD